MILGSSVESANDEKDSGHGEHTIKVGRASSNVWHDTEPRYQGSKQGHSVSANVEMVGGVGVETDLLEEVGRVVSKVETRENLTSEYNDGNLGSSKFEALEAVAVRSADGKLLFEAVGVDNEAKGIAELSIGGTRSESGEALEGIVVSAKSNKMPGSVGSKAENRHQNNRPEPLERKGDAIRPRSRSVDKTSHDASRDELSDDETHVGPAGHVNSKRHGKNFRGIGWRSRSEDTPGETAEDLSNEEDFGVGSEEDDEDEAAERNQGSDEDLDVTILGDEVTVEKSSKE